MTTSTRLPFAPLSETELVKRLKAEVKENDRKTRRGGSFRDMGLVNVYGDAYRARNGLPR